MKPVKKVKEETHGKISTRALKNCDFAVTRYKSVR